MLTQENIISNIELRSDFSLYCVHMETQLVYAYLETLSSILNSLVSLRIRSHSEVVLLLRINLKKFGTFVKYLLNFVNFWNSSHVLFKKI